MEERYAKTYLENVAAAEAQREMVVAAIALKRYYLRKCKYPTELAELVPLYLRALPVDWMDGKPLRYRLKEGDEFVLYSVGENRTDDGGDPSVTGDSFSFWRGKDAVWPMPATAEEIAADNAAIEKRNYTLARRYGVPQMSQELRQRYGLAGPTNTPATIGPK